MSFPESLSLSGTTDVTFSKQSDDADNVVYIADTSPVGLPEQVTLSHKMAKPALNAVDRHALRYSLTVSDEAGKLAVLPISISISKPRQIITDAHVVQGLALLVDFLTTGGYMTKFLRGEL